MSDAALKELVDAFQVQEEAARVLGHDPAFERAVDRGSGSEETAP